MLLLGGTTVILLLTLATGASFLLVWFLTLYFRKKYIHAVARFIDKTHHTVKGSSLRADTAAYKARGGGRMGERL